MAKNESTGWGLSFPMVLGLTFVVLKLCKVIDWNWWWVLAPFWGGIAIAILIFAVIIFLKVWLDNK